VRLGGSLFFGAVSHVAETLAKMEEHRPGQRHPILSATGINFIDVAGAELLAEEAKRRRSMGGALSDPTQARGVRAPQPGRLY
jgi:SulP family sulfate permease